MKIFGKFTGKQQWWSAILVKLQSFRLQIQIEFLRNILRPITASSNVIGFVCIEKIKFPESDFASNSFLKSLLFSVTWLSSDSGSSWLWITFSLKHFTETFQTKSLFTVIFSMYWFRKHCLHYTFICSVLCLALTCWKEKNFRKAIRRFVTS